MNTVAIKIINDVYLFIWFCTGEMSMEILRKQKEMPQHIYTKYCALKIERKYVFTPFERKGMTKKIHLNYVLIYGRILFVFI